MTERELTKLLARKEEPGRQNAALVLHPQITRSAAQLRKKRRDRNALLLTSVLALLFLTFSIGAVLMAPQDNGQMLIQVMKYIALGGMGLTLLLSPLLAWLTDREEAQTE